MYIIKFTHHAIGGVAAPYLHAQSATTAYFGCMEPLLPPHPFRAAPSSPGGSSLFDVATRAIVHVRRARQGPAPDPTLHVQD